jgi:hypothetical protein
MFKLINIKPESIDLTKISKIISNIVLGNNSFLYISSDSNSLYQLSVFIEHLYNLFRADDEDKQHYYDDLINFYDRCKNQNGQQIINSYDNNVELIGKGLNSTSGISEVRSNPGTSTNSYSYIRSYC